VPDEGAVEDRVERNGRGVRQEVLPGRTHQEASVRIDNRRVVGAEVDFTGEGADDANVARGGNCQAGTTLFLRFLSPKINVELAAAKPVGRSILTRYMSAPPEDWTVPVPKLKGV